MSDTPNSQVQDGLAKFADALNYNAIAREIRKAKTKAKIISNVNFMMRLEKINSFDPLIDPETRRRVPNPNKENYLKLRRNVDKLKSML